MSAQVIYLENALVLQGRRTELVEPRSIAELAPKNWVNPYVAFLDGEPILRADWELVIEDEQSLAFIDVGAIPQGGGGGSDPLRTVLMIAVMVYAPTLAANMIYGSSFMAAAALGSTGFAIFNGVAIFAGMSLLNAVLPAPKPTSPQQAAALAAPSPTYSLNAQGNTARLEAAIPEHFGRMLSYLDFAAMPYTEYAGNEQYLYQLLCVGRGQYSIESIRIEDTPITSFPEVDYEIVAPGGTLTKFPSAVVTSAEVSGQDMSNATIIGPFVASASGTLANYIGIDYVMPRGLYYANDDGSLASKSVSIMAEAQAINDVGVATGVWFTLGTETITAATTTAQRVSYKYAVTAGRYQVRVHRTDTKDTATRSGHDAVWASMRAYLIDNRTFGDVTLIAMKLRASNSLSSQASRKVNVTATRMIPTWNGAAWTANTATRSIAWALVYAAKQVGLTDAEIDIAGLNTLNTTWTTRGDYFDARFDNFLSFWEAATKIAAAGRAKPYMQGGVLRVTRDQAASVPVALYSMRNIVKGSFSVNYLMPTPETADAVNVGYFDNTAWVPARVQAKLAGSTASKPAKIDMFGVTDRSQAYREGLYQAACNRYRRKLIKFSTEMEGFIPSFGDLVAIQHDMPGWGQSGEVTAWDSVTKTLTLSETLTWSTGTHYIAFRKRDGSLDGPYVAISYGGPNQCQLSVTPTTTPYTGQAEERTHYVFGWADTYRQQARVVSARPSGLYRVELTCINEDSNVHTADTGVTTPVISSSQLSGMTNTPVVTGLRAVGLYGTRHKVTVSWAPSAWATTYYVEQSADAGVTWERVADTANTSITFTAIGDPVTNIRVSALALARGAWTTTTYTMPALEDVAGFSVTNTPSGLLATWNLPLDTDYAETEIRIGTPWASSTFVARSGTTSFLIGYKASGSYTFLAKHFDTFKKSSVNAASSAVTVSVPGTPTVSVAIVAESEIISWTIPSSAAPLSSYEIRYGTDFASGTFVATVAGNTYKRKIDYTGSRTYWVAAKDIMTTQGAAGSASSTITIPGAPVVNPAAYADTSVTLSWTPPVTGNLIVDHYDIKYGSVWASGVVVASVAANAYSLVANWFGGRSFMVAAVDVAGNTGAVATISTTINQPAAVAVNTPSIVGRMALVSWVNPTVGNGYLPIRDYEVRRGASWATGVTVAITADTKIQLEVDWTSTATFWVMATDVNGNAGLTTGTGVSNISAPGAVTPSATVVGSDAVITWADAAINGLPVDRYEVRYGATWAAGVVVGSVVSKTITVPVTWLGARTFWVAAVDTSGNYATGTSTTAPLTISAHGAVGVLAASVVQSTDSIALTWTASTGTLPVDYYEIRFGGVFATAQVVGTTKSTMYTVPVTWSGARTFWVVPRDVNGTYGTESSPLASSTTITALTAVSPSKLLIGNKVELSWAAPSGSLLPQKYEIRVGATYGASTLVAFTTATKYRAPIDWAPGTQTFWVAAYDAVGVGATTGNVPVLYDAPQAPVIDNTNSSVGGALLDQFRLAWSPSVIGVTNIPVSGYVVGYDTVTLGTVNATTYSAPAVWSGNRNFWVKAVDINGNVGAQSAKTLAVTAPSAPSALTVQVVDNNVLLYWSGATGTLPITGYEIAKEPTFNTNAPATYVGMKSGGFTTVFETASATYTYYIRAWDSAGNTGTVASRSATVSQPQDYVLRANWDSAFGGTKSNTTLSQGALVLPINLTESYQTHFSSRAWTTLQAQVSAGYLYYATPNPTSGYYEEVFDYGTTIASSRITVTPTATTVGTVTLTYDLSTSPDNVNWTLYSNSQTAFGTSFRYVKVRVTATASTGNGLARLSKLNVVLDAKLKNDAGMAACLSTDVGGTVVTFGTSFIDVSSITLSPAGTTRLTAVYDFVDAPNPTSFKILLFDANGIRASGTVSWTAKGY